MRAPAAVPRIDPDTGLHAEDCPCTRCECGFRPTAEQRWRAREAIKSAALARARVATSAAAEVRKEVRKIEREARSERARQEARQVIHGYRIAAQRAAVPDDDELRTLREMFGIRKGKRR